MKEELRDYLFNRLTATQMDQYACAAIIGLLSGGYKFENNKELCERAWDIAEVMVEEHKERHG